MENSVITIFKQCGIELDEDNNIKEQIIERDIFLSNKLYQTMETYISKIKQHMSSSSLTSLQETAQQSQKWPLLNLVRQLLKVYRYSLIPIRKSNGYDKNGKKLYRRVFLIRKM